MGASSRRMTSPRLSIDERSLRGLQTNQAEQVQLERQECGCCEGETAPEEEDGLQILSADCQCCFVTLLFELQNRSISLSSTMFFSFFSGSDNEARTLCEISCLTNVFFLTILNVKRFVQEL